MTSSSSRGSKACVPCLLHDSEALLLRRLSRGPPFFLSPMAFAVPVTQTQRCSLTQTEACTCQRCLDQAHWESKPLIITFNRFLQRYLSLFNQREQEPSLYTTPSSCYLADRYNICAESIGENTQI